MEGPAQCDQQVDIRVSHQWRHLGASTSHPREDVGVAAELRERTYIGECGAEITEEAADDSAVVANGFGIECGAERRDGVFEGICQRVLKRRPSCAIHD
jgi:hypothetical protein